MGGTKGVWISHLAMFLIIERFIPFVNQENCTTKNVKSWKQFGESEELVHGDRKYMGKTEKMKGKSPLYSVKRP